MPSTSSTSKPRRSSRTREASRGSRSPDSRTSRSSGSYRHVCPRCGRTLARNEAKGKKTWILGLLFLRPYRCHGDCTYTTVRFSSSYYRRRQRKLRIALVVVFFFVAAGFTVRYMLARAGGGASPTGNEGIGETD